MKKFLTIIFLCQLLFVNVVAQDAAYLRSQTYEPWGAPENINAMNDVFGSGNWTSAYFETTNANTLFSNSHKFVFIDGSDGGTNAMFTFLQANLNIIENWVAQGNTLYFNSASNQRGGNVGFGVIFHNYVDYSFNYNVLSASVTVSNPSHPLFSKSFQPNSNSYSGTYFAHDLISGSGLIVIITGDGNDIGVTDIVLAEKTWGSGKVMFGGITTPNFHAPNPEARNLRRNILEYLYEEASPCSAPEVSVPNISAIANDVGLCSASVTFEATATGTDPAISYTVNGSPITSPHTFPVGTTTVTATATNDCGSDSKTFNVTVTNDAPVLSSITPSTLDPVQINTAFSASATFTDNNLQSATWNWGDGTTSTGTISGTTISGSRTYTAAGVYTLDLSVSDACNSSASTNYQYVVVYDPSGGFVTGGGWINSPAGAYKSDAALAGRANFGFVSKYQKGAKIPTGHTNFQFQVADLHFSSTSYEWLVVSGATARYKGVGTINGIGNYGFILSAIDGQVSGGGGYDKFRIKIWDKNNNDLVVYDNNLGDGSDDAFAETIISGGSIVVHEALKASSNKRLSSADGLELKLNQDFYAYPTAFSARTMVAFTLDREDNYTLEVFDVRGALVKHIANGTAEANKVYEFELRGEGMAEGVYITRLTTSTKVQSLKTILKR